MPIYRCRRREFNPDLNSIKIKAFASLNASIDWIGITPSPFCADFSIRLKKAAPNSTVHDFISQASVIRSHKQLVSSVSFPRFLDDEHHGLSVLLLSDAGRSAHRGQFCYIYGLLVDQLRIGSIYYVLSWSFNRFKLPVRSISATEILASGEAINEGKILAQTLSCLYSLNVPLIVPLHFLYLFTYLSMQPNLI